MSMFRLCRSGGEHLCIEPLAHFFYLPVISVALAQANVFCEILNKIAKTMKIFVKVDLLHSYTAPY